jgi:uncharacterized protein YjbI with pentapeptide repeats
LHEKRNKRWHPRYVGLPNVNLLSPTLTEMDLGIADTAAADLTGADLDTMIEALQKRGSEVQSCRLYETLRAIIRWGLLAPR